MINVTANGHHPSCPGCVSPSGICWKLTFPTIDSCACMSCVTARAAAMWLPPPPITAPATATNSPRAVKSAVKTVNEIDGKLYETTEIEYYDGSKSYHRTEIGASGAIFKKEGPKADKPSCKCTHSFMVKGCTCGFVTPWKKAFS